MLPAARSHFEQVFTEDRYRAFVDAVTAGAGVPIEFRLSETPCFFPSALMESLVTAAQAMTQQLLDNGVYRAAADAMVPSGKCWTQTMIISPRATSTTGSSFSFRKRNWYRTAVVRFSATRRWISTMSSKCSGFL